MASMGKWNACNPLPHIGASSLFENGTLVVSLLGIIEDISPTLRGPNLDIFNKDLEWTVPKRKNRGNKVDVRSTERVGRPPIRIIHQKDLEKEIT